MTEPIIGIIAGAGPFAGLDLATKILEQTDASCDQEYLPMVSVSTPGEIEDRTRFLLGESEENPAYALAKNFLDLQRMNAKVIGMPCNTAHAAPILEVFYQEIAPHAKSARYLDMIQETVNFIGSQCPTVKNIGSFPHLEPGRQDSTRNYWNRKAITPWSWTNPSKRVFMRKPFFTKNTGSRSRPIQSRKQPVTFWSRGLNPCKK